ncbi:hypothetical protein MSG28_014231, partial [Choristoneura fumiferana]
MEYSGEKSVLSDQEIINETTNIILAGQDTSASTIVYALILLGSHPEIQEQNCTLPAGSSAFLAIHALHRLKMWGDDVEHFVPDRWLDKSRIPEHPAAFAAFSIGRRMCI